MLTVSKLWKYLQVQKVQVTIELNPLHAKFIQREQKHVFTFHVISTHWYDASKKPGHQQPSYWPSLTEIIRSPHLLTVTSDAYGFSGSVLQITLHSKCCLAHWISKLPWSNKIQWVRNYLVIFTGLVGIVNAIFYKTAISGMGNCHHFITWHHVVFYNWLMKPIMPDQYTSAVHPVILAENQKGNIGPMQI